MHKCDPSKVEQMIAYFSDTASQQQPPISVKWNEICMNIPGFLYSVLVAWENETIAPAAVLKILDNMRSKMCCFAVIGSAWLCSYMNTLLEDEQAKPRMMVQQLIKPLDESTIQDQEHFTEKFTLTREIIVNSLNSRSPIEMLQKATSNEPLVDQYLEQWNEIYTKQLLSFDVAMNLELMVSARFALKFKTILIFPV